MQASPARRRPQSRALLLIDDEGVAMAQKDPCLVGSRFANFRFLVRRRLWSATRPMTPRQGLRPVQKRLACLPRIQQTDANTGWMLRCGS